MVRSFHQGDETERRFVKNMLKEKITWGKTQKITGRSSDTLSSIAKSRLGCLKKKGAAKKIPVKALPKILKATARLQKKAKAEKEVTADNQCPVSARYSAQTVPSTVPGTVPIGKTQCSGEGVLKKNKSI